MEEALKDSDSVFHYYQKLIRLRHEEDILTEGSYRLLLPEDDSLFVYQRNIKGKSAGGSNLTDVPVPGSRLEGILYPGYKAIIQNEPEIMKNGMLQPFEAFIAEEQL